ncbi:hypothetical protein TorRG33x02_030230 [Trema orientale]|uniref:Uncharacterized protein n=1 Tax=Trema orientale TaxID=63057 RepID=A0A2P5FU20_TREOI|nr:hypothetical protein TorRG33x02_030230 [Trema orientale]
MASSIAGSEPKSRVIEWRNSAMDSSLGLLQKDDNCHGFLLRAPLSCQSGQKQRLVRRFKSRETADVMEILKLMSSTLLIALCQAIDLKQQEEISLKNLVPDS